MSVLGLAIPDGRPVFVAVLAVHVVAGLTVVSAGALAALARKRRGWHPAAGRVFAVALGVLAGSALALAGLRWRQDRHLAVVALVAAGFGAVGWWARRRRPRRWPLWHGLGMAGAYVAALTGFYVDNGPLLPLWDRLPPIAYWFLPALVGVPLTWRALCRNHAVGPGAVAVTRRR